MKKTLVILAAGLGSRFGGGIKQLEPIDDYGHIIIDYSIHDAIAAGFQKIVFIIRHDIESDFKEVIGNRIENVCASLEVEVCYAFQEMSNVPDFTNKALAKGRTKPWGTGHAVLACEGLLDSPFTVINADDYYGMEGFKKAANFLEDKDGYGLVGYQLKNTLSDNGGVTRGVCTVEEGKLTQINETKNIVKVTDTADGGTYKAVSGDKTIDINSLVSMNFWCYPVSFMQVLKDRFIGFLEGMSDPMTDEYLLPIIADGMIKDGYEFSVLPTDDKWFGGTYKEDKEAGTESIRKGSDEGVYESELYVDW